MRVQTERSFYCLTMYCRAREHEPNTRGQDGGDRLFMQCADPVLNLSIAFRMAWYVLGKYRGDYGFLYFEQSEDLLLDEGPWIFKPRYCLVAPNCDYGIITQIKEG